MNGSARHAKVTVVIVNWQRPEDTLECLRSVYAEAVEGLDVLLVDNGSRDDSIQRIGLEFPQLEILALPENTGFAGGYNAGMQAAFARGAERVFILNNDTILESGALAALLASSWDAAVPKIVYADRPEQIWAAGCRWRNFPPSVIMIGYNQPDGPQYDQPGRLDYATGCALLLSRAAIQATGGFDEQFVNYMEDYDFAYRLSQAGFQMGYVPAARIRHKVSRSLGANSAQRWRYLTRNTVLFYCKDNRFPRSWLWSYLTWYCLREVLKGNIKALPDIFAGIRRGFAACQERGKKRHGSGCL